MVDALNKRNVTKYSQLWRIFASKRIGAAIPGLPGIATGTGITAAAVKMRRRATFPAWTLPRLSPAIPLAVVPRWIGGSERRYRSVPDSGGSDRREADVPDVWDDAMEVCRRALDLGQARTREHCIACRRISV